MLTGIIYNMISCESFSASYVGSITEDVMLFCKMIFLSLQKKQTIQKQDLDF